MAGFKDLLDPRRTRTLRAPRKPKTRYAGPGKVTIPGFTPDYGDLIENDPTYIDLRNALNARRVQSGAQRRQGIQQALIGLGLDPGEGFQDPFGDVDELTRSLARQASESGVGLLARMQRQHDQQLNLTRNTLAARGLNPGTYRRPELEQRREFTNATFDTVQEAQEYIAGLLAAYAEQSAGFDAELAAGATDAAERQMGLPQNAPVPDMNAPHLKGTRGFYRGEDGVLYNKTGQKIDVAKARKRYTQMVNQARRRGVNPRNTWYFKRLLALGG